MAKGIKVLIIILPPIITICLYYDFIVNFKSCNIFLIRGLLFGDKLKNKTVKILLSSEVSFVFPDIAEQL